MRGTLPCFLQPLNPVRFIPTHVGNTMCQVAFISPTPVHPHACGEHIDPSATICLNYGSSPRMWGTQTQLETKTWRERFIPTHVGNTFYFPSSCSMASVHPHACGEHAFVDLEGQSFVGSSPRMWGTRPPAAGYGHNGRFIPTHVGNTRCESPAQVHRAVHPHACGEHVLVPMIPSTSNGSSPRMWGTHCLFNQIHIILRFIPTHVGNTLI